MNTTTKDAALQIIRDQPDDVTFDELIRELAFHRMIERGLADIEAGRTTSNEALKQRVESWFQSNGQ